MRSQKSKTLTFLAAMALVLPLQHTFSVEAAEAWIEKVNVHIEDAKGGTSPVLLKKMEDSMQVVADQLLLNKRVGAVSEAKNDYQRLLTEIGDRVFTGYELSRVELWPGAATELHFVARPWNGTIDKVDVDLQFSGIDAQEAALLHGRVPELEEQLRTTIQGASVAAGDWAGGVLRRMVRQQVEQQLPEFKAAVDVISEKDRTVVQVVIYPVGQLVTNVHYEMHSESIPNLLLLQLKSKYQEECNKLRGLPVEYVQRHLPEIEQTILENLLQEKEVRDYNLKPIVKLVSGSTLNVDIDIASDEYKIYLEGYADIGRDKENLSGKAHVGKFISTRDEVFGEAEVILDDVTWRYGFGYARYWGKSNWSYMRRMPTGDNIYKLEYNLSPKWRLRAEHHSGNDRNEYGVRYRFHEFLSTEYVYGGDEFYLRIIGNL